MKCPIKAMNKVYLSSWSCRTDALLNRSASGNLSCSEQMLQCKEKASADIKSHDYIVH